MLRRCEDNSIPGISNRRLQIQKGLFPFFGKKSLTRGASEWQNESLNSNCAWVLAVNLQKIWNFTQPILFRGFPHWSPGNRASGSLASKLTNKSPLKSSLLLKHIQGHALSDQPGVLQRPTGSKRQTVFIPEILNLPRKALWCYCSSPAGKGRTQSGSIADSRWFDDKRLGPVWPLGKMIVDGRNRKTLSTPLGVGGRKGYGEVDPL